MPQGQGLEPGVARDAVHGVPAARVAVEVAERQLAQAGGLAQQRPQHLFVFVQSSPQQPVDAQGVQAGQAAAPAHRRRRAAFRQVEVRQLQGWRAGVVGQGRWVL